MIQEGIAQDVEVWVEYHRIKPDGHNRMIMLDGHREKVSVDKQTGDIVFEWLL